MVLALLLKMGSPVAPVGHALTRLTLSPNALVGGVKGNVVPDVCTVRRGEGGTVRVGEGGHGCSQTYAIGFFSTMHGHILR